MPTRDQILDPDVIPCTGWLRWLETGKTDPPRPTAGMVLQRFNADRGEWQDVPVVTQQELDTVGVK